MASGSAPKYPNDRFDLLEAQIARLEQALARGLPGLEHRIVRLEKLATTVSSPASETTDASEVEQATRTIESHLAKLSGSMESADQSLRARLQELTSRLESATERVTRIEAQLESEPTRGKPWQPELEAMQSELWDELRARTREMHEVRDAVQEQESRLREKVARLTGSLEQQLTSIERRFDAAFRHERQRDQMWRWILIVGLLFVLIIALSQ